MSRITNDLAHPKRSNTYSLSPLISLFVGRDSWKTVDPELLNSGRFTVISEPGWCRDNSLDMPICLQAFRFMQYLVH